jgi:dienelactone hydrolase
MAVDMQPIVFDRLLGWLHMPVGPISDTGVVLISPLGRDERCTHMPMRLFADQLASAGFPTLRYDHLGTGDSLDLPDEDADAFPEWLKGMEFAADVLRERVGVRRIVQGGVRLGATFAGANSGRADGLLLLAPVLSGRSWLGRLRFSARMARNGSQAREGEPLDSDGLWLSPATARSLTGVDLARTAAPSAPIFVASQNQLVSTYAEGLSKTGAAVRTVDFPGFNELFLEPAVNSPPDQVFASARTWLLETFEGTASATNSPRSQTQADEPVLRPPGAVERSVTFGGGLRGVLCEPEHAIDGAPTVLFCNSGGDPRAGCGGFASKTSRRLAIQGVTSLRFDMAGLGDSAMPGDVVRCHVFETPREVDMDAAVDLLAERGHVDIVVVGLCSGAYHALHSAWRNPRVTGIAAVSPVKILWRPGDSVGFARDEYLLSLNVYAKSLFDPAAWKRAIQKRISIVALFLALANRLRNRLLGWFTRRDDLSPLTEMRRFAQRGGRACFVMGVDDASLEEMETYFGPGGAELKQLKSVSVEVIPDLDHGLARRTSREIMENLLARWLEPSRVAR